MDNTNNVLQEEKIQKSDLKIITNKQRKSFSLFLFISGIGSGWLTYWWYKVAYSITSGWGHADFYYIFNLMTVSPNTVLYYYIFNSILLTIIGILLYKKYFKIYSFLSLILGISVIASFFVWTEKLPLFFYTVLMGMSFGGVFGGIILVPMFLRSVYKSFIDNIRVMTGKLTYETIDNENNSEKISFIQKASTVLAENKSKINKLIPQVAMFFGIISIFFILQLGFSSANSKSLLILIIPIIVVALAILSLKSKTEKVSNIVNIILFVLFLLPIILSLTGLSSFIGF